MYRINGQELSIGQEPQMRGGTLYVPIADLVEALGGRISWDNNQKVATATIGQWTATVRMADRNVDVSGTPVSLAADPFVEDDLLWVPVTFFRDAYGYKVEADPGTRHVSIALPTA
jgi:hypothetical protein